MNPKLVRLSNKYIFVEEFHEVVCWWKKGGINYSPHILLQPWKTPLEATKKIITTKNNSNRSETKLLKVYTALWLDSG